MDLLPVFRSDLPRWLVSLDLQRGTGVDPPAEAIENCGLILREARAAEWRIVHVHRCFRGGAAYGPPPMRGLEPLPDEALLYRSELSAFSNRKFAELIDAAPAQVAIMSSDVSAVLSTALSAVERGHRVSLLQVLPVDRHIFSAFRHLLNALSAGDLHLVEPVSIPEARLRLVEKAV